MVDARRKQFVGRVRSALSPCRLVGQCLFQGPLSTRIRTTDELVNTSPEKESWDLLSAESAIMRSTSERKKSASTERVKMVDAGRLASTTPKVLGGRREVLSASNSGKGATRRTRARESRMAALAAQQAGWVFSGATTYQLFPRLTPSTFAPVLCRSEAGVSAKSDQVLSLMLALCSEGFIHITDPQNST
jgi:hypothetical protein